MFHFTFLFLVTLCKQCCIYPSLWGLRSKRCLLLFANRKPFIYILRCISKSLRTPCWFPIQQTARLFGAPFLSDKALSRRKQNKPPYQKGSILYVDQIHYRYFWEGIFCSDPNDFLVLFSRTGCHKVRIFSDGDSSVATHYWLRAFVRRSNSRMVFLSFLLFYVLTSLHMAE